MNKTIAIGTNEIAYRVSGNGQPVMLLHGFGETGDVWKKQAPALETAFRLLIPDLPGSGDSAMGEDLSMEGMATTIKRIWDAEKQTPDDRLIIIGHSMGGYITLAFAEKYAGDLHAFGLFHSTAFADTEEKKATRRKGIDFIRQHGAFEFLKTSTPNLFSETSKQQSPGMIHDFIQTLNSFSGEALTAYYQAMIERPDRTGILRQTELPVLFIAGAYDNAAPLQDVLKQCHLPSRSYFHVFDRSAHMGMMEEPERSTQALLDFLNDVTAPAN